MFQNLSEGKISWQFYNSIYAGDYNQVEKYLNDGADPNYCRGEGGWIDSNPLNVITDSFYTTYYRYKRGETILFPTPDVRVFELLLKFGADINRRPYIWNRVNRFDNELFKRIYGELNQLELEEAFECYLNDSNRILEVFLKSGADPDKLGHPYPYCYDAFEKKITDEEANEYFERGSRAINVAIKKGIRWESQVDLLLQYTSLDEESLHAAERSNDPAMIEKITKLWENQQAER
jgi:hypothetical protein